MATPTRILIVASETSLFKPEMFEYLVRNCPGRVLAIAITSFRPRKTNRREHLRRYLELLGLYAAVNLAMRATFYKALDVLSRAFRLPRAYSVAGLARRYGIPLWETENINSPEFLERVRGLQPDLILSAGNQILGKRLLSLPRTGCINKHCSLLPTYGGLYPIFWQLLRGETTGGVTLHWMSAEVDRGDICLQRQFPLDRRRSFMEHYRHAFLLAGEMMVELVQKLEAGERPRLPQQGEPSYFGYPARAEARRFRRQGLRMV